MNYFLFVIIFTTLAFGQTSPPATAAPSVPIDQENAHKAKALIDQMIDALGGNAYLNVEDVSQEGRTYSFHLGQSEGVGVLFWRFYKFPDKDRVELTKKRDVVYVYRGDQGFEITYKGTRADDPKAVSDYLRRREFSLDWVLRKWLHEAGHRSVLRGPHRSCTKRRRASHDYGLEQSERNFVHRQQHAFAGEEKLFVARSDR